MKQDNVIQFPTITAVDPFRKALATVKVMTELSGTVALMTLQYWQTQGIITKDEHAALLEFYGIV